MRTTIAHTHTMIVVARPRRRFQRTKNGVLIHCLNCRPEVMGADAVQGMYKAIVEFVQVEYIGGSCEGGQGCKCQTNTLVGDAPY